MWHDSFFRDTFLTAYFDACRKENCCSVFAPCLGGVGKKVVCTAN